MSAKSFSHSLGVLLLAGVPKRGIPGSIAGIWVLLACVGAGQNCMHLSFSLILYFCIYLFCVAKSQVGLLPGQMISGC